jgi:hypothetical protein
MPPDGDTTYSAEELVALALAGHYLLNDTVDATVRRITRQIGEAGRIAMGRLPPLRQYAEDAEVLGWQDELLALEQALVAPRRVKPNDDSQLELPFP